MSQLHLYQASAGAGKTHALVHAYLRCALHAPNKLPHLLAITFTNKATEEMRHRFLRTTHQLATGQPTPLAPPLAQALGGAATLQARAQAFLAAMLHHHDHWHVTTIDAFFLHYLTPFLAQLGIPAGHSVTLQADSLVEEVVEALLETLPQTPTLQEALTTHALARVRAGKHWDLKRGLKELAYEELRHPLPLPAIATLKDHLHRHGNAVATTEQAFRTTATAWCHALAQAGWEAHDFAWGQRGIYGFLRKLEQGAWPAVTARITRASQDPTCWARKAAPHQAAITAHVAAVLQPALATLLPTYQDAHRDAATWQAWQPLRYLLATRQQWQELLAEHRSHAKVYLMADLPALLQRLHDQQGTLWTQLRLGQAYHHLLIDEFQDVATAQWEGMRPLVEAALAQGHQSFLVGDAKQAIYRWRGGNAQLLLHDVAAQVGERHTTVHHLPYNWRSAPHVVAFNNTLFSSAAAHLARTLQEEAATHVTEQAYTTLHQAIDQLRHAYAHAKQALPERKHHPHAGHLQLTFLPTTNAEGAPTDWMTPAIQHTLHTITALQEAGHAAHDIALLVRNHREAQHLLAALHHAATTAPPAKQPYYRAMASSALQLGQSPHLQLLVRTLEALHHPTSLPHWQHLCHDYLRHGAGRDGTRVATNSYALPSLEALHPLLPAQLTKEGAHLLRLPLQLLCHTLLQLLGITQAAAQPYLHALWQAIHTLCQAESADPPAFLAWWHKEGAHQPLPTHAPHTLQVMTLHQAKGLAFPFVLLPFAAWSLDHPPHHPPILWCDHATTPRQPLPPLPVYYGKHLLATHYQTHYYQEKWKTYLEQFNLLYVGLTRAVKGLYLFAPQVKEGSPTTTVAHLLDHWRRHLPTASEQPPIAWARHWDATTHTHTLTLGTIPPPEASSQAPPTTPTHTVQPLQKPSHSLLNTLGPAHGAQGNWWHDFLAQLTHAAEAPTLVAHYQALGKLTPAAASDLLATLQEWWKQPQLASWFSPAWQVKCEATLLLPNGTLLRPDRVMVADGHAVVLDFKSGTPTPAHRHQVGRYAQYLRQMDYTSVHAYLFYLPTQQLVQVAA